MSGLSTPDEGARGAGDGGAGGATGPHRAGPDRPDPAPTRRPWHHALGPSAAWALFGGILAWLVHLAGIAWSVGRACATGTAWPIHLLTVVALVVVGHALWVSWRIARADPTTPGRDAARILGWLAVVLNVANLVLVVVEWAPVLVLSPCAA